MSAALLIASLLLLLAAIAVRFAGSDRLLNFIDYSKVGDRAALHRWVGNRMLLLAPLTAALAAGAWRAPAYAFVFVLAAFVLAVAVWIWIAAGSARFQNRGIPNHRRGER